MQANQSASALDASTALRALTDVAATLAWLRSLRRLPVARAVPMLLVRLEGLRRAEPEPRVLLDILRLLRHALLRLTAALPSPDPRRPAGGLGDGRGLTLQQRLDMAMRANLRQLFHALDRNRFGAAAVSESDREWVLRNLFKFLRRQVRYALLARRACPPGTWQDLHDLFVYLVIRGNVRVDDGIRVDDGGAGFHPETEYKRLLLMGRAQQLGFSGEGILRMIPRLSEWSRGSRLVDPLGRLGLFELLLVEVSRDRPLRLNDGGLDETFRGWVLEPDARFAALCRREAGAADPFARYRSA
jgi:hypothetical protein